MCKALGLITCDIKDRKLVGKRQEPASREQEKAAVIKYFRHTENYQ